MSIEVEVAITDIHGKFDLLRKALDYTYSEFPHKPLRFIFTGDMIDRGPDSKEVLDLIKSGPEREGDEFIALVGNHDDWAIQAHDAYMAWDEARLNRDSNQAYLWSKYEGVFGNWFEQGGAQTLRSYMPDARLDNDFYRALGLMPIDWLKTLPFMYETDTRLYVHAGISPGGPLERQDRLTCTWIRYEFLYADAGQFGDFKKHIVHGHTPQHKNKVPGQPELLPHRTNLDCAAAYGHNLAVGYFLADQATGPFHVELFSASDD